MQNPTEIKNSTDLDCEFDFNFELSTFECFLIIPYAIFVLPVIIVVEGLGKLFDMDGKKVTKSNRLPQEHFQAKEQLGASCPWPRQSHGYGNL